MPGLSVNLDSVIPSLVDTVLDRKTGSIHHPNGVTVSNGIALGVSTSIRAPYGDNLELPEAEVYVDFQFLFHGRTSVWAAGELWSHTLTNPDNRVMFHSTRDVPLDRWVNTSNHDSCWRSDGLRIIWTKYMEAVELLQGAHPAFAGIAPRDFYQFTRFEFGDMFKPVRIATCRVPERTGNSFRTKLGLLWVENKNGDVIVGDRANDSAESVGKQVES